MRVFVTGGSGFLGSAVVRALGAEGHEVVALVRSSSVRAHLDAAAFVRVVVGTLEDETSLEEHMRGCEGLCHVAGAAGRFYADPSTYERSNHLASEQVFRAARRAGISRAVYTGTVAQVLELDNAYAHSKRRGAQAARREAGPDMDVVVVHPSGMIGAHDRKPTPLGRAIADYARGELKGVVGGGSGYIHVDDAAAGHVAALVRGDPTREYLLDGDYWRTRDLFDELAAQCNRAAPRVLPVGLAHAMAIVMAPLWGAFKRTPPITTFVTSYLKLGPADPSRAEQDRQALGVPAYRDVPQMLRDALAWFEQQSVSAEAVGPK